ncbi:hypothetical protein [Haloglomus litoreum]|uniref:hypothetical protein n=1 Tax=Haloglomus litoreum TaxID=3034026 RepID=UPI0023E8E363|nr:hypothetical protein [Haloglomus sp. DT116]
MTVPSAYRPGACNIGRSARRQRGLVALVSLVGAGGYAAFVLVSDLPTLLLLGLFVPLSLGIEWGLQARRSFCVTLALQGRYDFREPRTDGGETDQGQGTVPDEAARSEDRRYALQLTLIGLAAGALLTGLVYAGAVLLGL